MFWMFRSTMIEEQLIREYVRDRRTWRRAASQHTEEQTTSIVATRNALWPTFRHGSSENADAIKFTNTLRGSLGRNDPYAESASAPRWNTSIRLSVSDDILYAALAKGLVAKNLTGAWLTDSSQQVGAASKQRPISAARGLSTKESAATKKTALLVRQLMVVEKEKRALIYSYQTQAWKKLFSAHTNWSLNELLRLEVMNRRLIFKDEVCERDQIVVNECSAFSEQFHVSHATFQMLHRLQVHERRTRGSIRYLRQKQLDIIQQASALEHLEIVERELTQCAMKEAFLYKQLPTQVRRRRPD